MSKVLKKTVSQDLQRRLGSLDSYLVVDFRGINSAQSFELRRLFLDVGVKMQVVPNRMAMRILDRWEGKREDFRTFFRGPTAILHGGESGALTASRAAMQWKKKNKNLLPIKGAVLEGEILLPEAAEGLAKVPDRLQLLGMVASCFNAPLVRLAVATQGTLANLVRTVEALRKKLAEATPAAAPPSPPGPPEGAVASSPAGAPEGGAPAQAAAETQGEAAEPKQAEGRRAGGRRRRKRMSK